MPSKVIRSMAKRPRARLWPPEGTVEHRGLVAAGRYEEADRVLGYHLGLMLEDEEAIRLRERRAGLRLRHLSDPRGAAVDLH